MTLFSYSFVIRFSSICTNRYPNVRKVEQEQSTIVDREKRTDRICRSARTICQSGARPFPLSLRSRRFTRRWYATLGATVTLKIRSINFVNRLSRESRGARELLRSFSERTHRKSEGEKEKRERTRENEREREKRVNCIANCNLCVARCRLYDRRDDIDRSVQSDQWIGFREVHRNVRSTRRFAECSRRIPRRGI